MELTTSKTIVALLMVFSMAGSVAYAQDEGDDMFELSLEDLMNMEITSVSKKAERLQDVASSIYVISSEDIKHSGATTLHEVLRLVPGYWGVQDEYSQAQSNIRYSEVSNGLTGTVLYLLDGTPIQDIMSQNFSFRNFDLPLDEIDRIEVIRGSGGTVYGANSATGVVNIFTKNPEDYDGINARAETGSGGYVNTTVRAGGKVSDKFAVSGYGKMRLFKGFGSLAGTNEDGDQVVNPSRFTEDFDKIDMFSFGLKANVALNEKSALSFKGHYNTLSTFDYSNHYGENFPITQQDVLHTNDVTANRLVANLRYDYSFSDDHSLFFRASTNAENDFNRLAGGFKVSNSIYDFEIQDNVSLGSSNDLSLGANYRLVNFDVHDLNAPDAIGYIDPQANETLVGVFAQDKIKLMDGKLNFILGIKAENYSLVNDDFYLSPMAKFSYIPTQNFTVWGGFTQAYSTPGFNNTNIELYLFQTPSPETWNGVATQGVYDAAYQDAIQGGADEATATAVATAFVQSAAGQAVIDAQTQGLIDQFPNVAVRNGTNTVPTRFRTWEIGFRANIDNQLTFESDFYHTTVNDGIGVSPNPAEDAESPTQPGRIADFYFYGNYVQGTVYGTESTIKIIPVSGITFEVTHSYLKSEWELQENDDFDISGLTPEQRDQTPEVAKVPSHVFRFKGNFDLPKGIRLGMSVIYGTKSNTQANYIVQDERYENVAISEPDTRSVIAMDADRTIVNMRLEKRWLDNKLSTYVFANDMFNDGREANTRNVFNTTRSQISAMYGIGLNYKFK